MVDPSDRFLDRGRRLCRSSRPLAVGIAAGLVLALAAIMFAA